MKTITVNIIDKDRFLSTTVHDKLNKIKGVKAQCYQTINEFLNSKYTKQSNLIFVDIHIHKNNYHELNAWDLLSHFSQDPNTPIVLLANDYDTELVTKSLNMGANDYILKSNYTIKLIEFTVKKYLLTNKI
jgi:FixJ family two-component response regulator